jgi:hypothetical protein
MQGKRGVYSARLTLGTYRPELKGGVWTWNHRPFAMSVRKRIDFYVTPDDRLLALGFYACAPVSVAGVNDGAVTGRVVREVYRNGTFEPKILCTGIP